MSEQDPQKWKNAPAISDEWYRDVAARAIKVLSSRSVVDRFADVKRMSGGAFVEVALWIPDEVATGEQTFVVPVQRNDVLYRLDRARTLAERIVKLCDGDS